jgi:hypothetical protein
MGTPLSEKGLAAEPSKWHLETLMRRAAGVLRCESARALRTLISIVPLILREALDLKIGLITHLLFHSSECFFYLSHVRAFFGPLIKGEVLVDSD